MRFIYTILFYLSLPFIGMRLLWRSRRNPAYAKRWSERFGCIPFTVKPQGIWWHSVSMGETMASIPMVRQLLQRYPDVPILVTTMTPSGSAQVLKAFGNTVSHMYIPYDLPHLMSKFIQTISPRLVVLMETELWPNLLHYCHRYKVPVLLANARLSEKSANGYARFGQLTREMMKNISLIAVQNKEDAARFIRLGFSPQHVSVTGTVKFDITIAPPLIEKAKTLRQQWGEERAVWIAASTHEGEEEIILSALKKIPYALLILAPRHPDRVKDILALCQKNNLTTCLRSKGELPHRDTQVFLVDTVGELLLFYALSDAAFVGGSLVNKGGHNLLEPAALGLPVLTGKYLYNFAQIEKLLESAHVLIKVKDALQLGEQVYRLLQSKEAREAIGHAAKQVVMENKGATEKHLALIDQLLQSNHQ